MDNHEFTQQLIDKAIAGKHCNFEFIRSRRELFAALAILMSTRIVANNFQKIANAEMKKYIKLMKTSPFAPANVTSLVSVKAMMQCNQYYREEVKLLWEMIGEYKAYLDYGHWLEAILGFYRPEEDLIRHDINIVVEI